MTVSTLKGSDRQTDRQTDRENILGDPSTPPRGGGGFVVPKNFECSPPSSDLKERFPDLARFANWNELPANLIPPGVARFKTWNEPAEFIPLDAPSDSGLKEKEGALKEKWNALLRRSAEDDEQSTTVTASMSADSSPCFADNVGTPGERSTTGNAPMFKFMEDDFEEDWSHFLEEDGDDDDDDDSSASNEYHEPGEGDAILHAMVLLGHRTVDGLGYWVMQNSWEGPTQILEVSTEYLIESGAYLYFYRRKVRSPKPEHQWSTEKGSSFFCPSPVAEISQLERSDCENWADSLVHSGRRQEASDIDGMFVDL